MKSILELILTDTILWDFYYRKDISDIWEGAALVGRGSKGSVYDIGGGRVCKVEDLHLGDSFSKGETAYPNPIFFEDAGEVLYIKQSFLLEFAVMLMLAEKESPIGPRVYACHVGFDKGKPVSVVVMERVGGISFNPGVVERAEKLRLYHGFLQHLSHLYGERKFIHGDLILANLFLQDNKLTCVDFGLSSFYENGKFICRYHNIQKGLMPEWMRDIQMLKKMAREVPSLDCQSVVNFIQRHRQAIDICKLLAHDFSDLPASFQKKIKTCRGRGGSLSLSNKPNPMYYSRVVISFKEALEALQI